MLKNRSESDLTWEQNAVDALLQTMQQLPKVARKTHLLLEHIEQRRLPGTDRVRQLVVFTRYGDTLSALHGELCRRLPRFLLQPGTPPFEQVQQCWAERRPLTAVELAGTRLCSVDEALAAGALKAQPVTLVTRTRPDPQRQCDALGRQQQILVEATAAHYAAVKLKQDPDTVKQPIAEFERFQADVQKRTPPAVYVKCKVPDRNALLAQKERLLCPVSNHAPAIGIDGDPLLLDAAHALILRQLGEMKKHDRTGPSVAKALRERARNS